MPHESTPRLPLTRRACLGGLAASLGAVSAWPLAQAQSRTRTEPPLLPRIVASGAEQPVRVARASAHVEITGLVARTRLELVLHNPNARVLEGELQFPLAPGQAVTGFALDINGELRPAVAVEKVKGRQVFEDTIRQRVDPALLEQLPGAHHKLRVYPLPARGERRVVLELQQTLVRSLRAGEPGVDFALPLQFGAGTALQVEVRLLGRVESPNAGGAYAGALALWRGQPVAWQGPANAPVLRINDVGREQPREPGRDAAPDLLQLRLPFQDRGTLSVVHLFGGQHYVYSELAWLLRSAPRPAPRRLALLWDASASGAQRDHAREFALLEALFQRWGDVQVQLLVVRDVAQPLQTFAVQRGRWDALAQALKDLPYDGATQLGALRAPEGSDLALLFSDGLGNYGDMVLPASPVPLVACSASLGSNAAALAAVAEASGGQHLDLLATDTRAAVQAVVTRRTRLVGLRGDGLADLVQESALPQHGRLVLAGRFTAPTGRLWLDLEEPDGQRRSHHLELRASDQAASHSAGVPVAAQRWAQLQLAAWAAQPQPHREAIRALGLQFGLATSETSLIVLDDVRDYVRHEITPPPSLRAAWESLMAERSKGRLAERGRHLAQVLQRFQQRVQWWETDFPKDTPPRPPAQDESEARRERAEPRAAAVGMAARPVPMPAPAAAPAAPMAFAERRLADAAPAAKATGPGEPQAPQASITLQPWQPDAPYARRLRAAPAAQLYALYLQERGAHAGSTAFYLDVADLLLQAGQAELGLRVLSNLAEMELENRHVLRVLAYRLRQAGQVKLALPLLQRVRELSPDEPQSWRDLGLALAADQQAQAAVNALWEVVSRPWQGRFPDVEQIALAELNAIAAREAAAGRALDMRAMDPRLLRNLPLDLRAVLAWDADNTDIDLWVEDPNGERAFYGHALTYQGGRMSADFTGGYGPEEFALRRAKPGTYTVIAQFFGQRQQLVAPATTVMLRLSTGFGSPQQQDQEVVLRLPRAGEQVVVGRFEVK